jgi:hypothetical protein
MTQRANDAAAGRTRRTSGNAGKAQGKSVGHGLVVRRLRSRESRFNSTIVVSKKSFNACFSVRSDCGGEVAPN